MSASQPAYLGETYQPSRRLLLALAGLLLAAGLLAVVLLVGLGAALADWQSPLAARLPAGLPAPLPPLTVTVQPPIRVIAVEESAIAPILADADRRKLAYARLSYVAEPLNPATMQAVILSGANPPLTSSLLTVSGQLRYTLATDQQPRLTVSDTTLIVELLRRDDRPLWQAVFNPATATLLLAGPQIATGNYATADLTDLAPTLAALLGQPPPTFAEGSILWQTTKYRGNSRIVAAGQYNLAAQRLRLAAAYRQATGQPTEPLYDDLQANLSAARAAYAAGNYSTTVSLSSVLAEADRSLQAAEQLTARNARYLRAILPLVLLLAGGLLCWLLRSRWLATYLVAAAAILLGEWLIVGLLARAGQLASPVSGSLLWPALIAAGLGQVAAALVVVVSQRRWQRGARFYGSTYLPGAAQAVVWQLRQPRSPRPLLAMASYRLGLVLVAMQVLVAAGLFAYFGFASSDPPLDRPGTLLFAYALALIVANALLSLVGPLLVWILHRSRSAGIRQRMG